MKAKYVLLSLIALAFFACDDNTGNLGLGMFPGSDQGINGRLSSFDVTTQSVHAGKVFSKTNIGYVGKFTDDTFGSYDAGFLAQLNCPMGLTFPQPYTETETSGGTATKATGTLVTDFSNVDMDDKSKSRYVLVKDDQGNVIGNCQVNIYLWYSTYFGDSLSACRLSVYEISKQALKEQDAHYTDINPSDYYDKANDLLGSKAYTAVDMSVSDSVRSLSTYMPSVSLRLNNDKAQELGDRLFQAAMKDGSNLYQDFTKDVFKGIYVKSDYGDGTVLYVSQIQLDVAFVNYVTDSITGVKLKTVANKDSVRFDGRSFNSTREVIQANQLKNDKEAIQKCIDNPDYTYLKSPAGIFTEATLPVSQIAEELKGDTLNAVKLVFPAYYESTSKKFGMTAPTSVLLLKKKDKDSFFESNKVYDNITSFVATATAPVTSYTFSNITGLVNSCLSDRDAAEKELQDKGSITLQIANDDGTTGSQTVTSLADWELYSDWNKVVLIPVLITTDTSSSNTTTVTGVQHDLKPGFVRLKGGTGGTKLKLDVISTNFGTTKAPASRSVDTAAEFEAAKAKANERANSIGTPKAQ
ncbi:MAG: DUF4270 domain-containing protein [Mediterranea sp.]|jgi:hypothetical protein|nr:DUF4270 domain-containing protein [Mediterranea sp.]